MITRPGYRSGGPAPAKRLQICRGNSVIVRNDCACSQRICSPLHTHTYTQTLERMISGDRYSGVPQRVHVRPFTFLANPKSVSCRRGNHIHIHTHSHTHTLTHSYTHTLTHSHTHTLTYLYVALAIDEDVLRFEVSIDNVEVVEVLKAQNNLRGIEPGVRLTTQCVYVSVCE